MTETKTQETKQDSTDTADCDYDALYLGDSDYGF